MAKVGIWVLIETDSDNFDNPDKPGNEEIREVFREWGQVGILDIVPESEVADIVLISDK